MSWSTHRCRHTKIYDDFFGTNNWNLYHGDLWWSYIAKFITIIIFNFILLLLPCPGNNIAWQMWNKRGIIMTFQVLRCFAFECAVHIQSQFISNNSSFFFRVFATRTHYSVIRDREGLRESEVCETDIQTYLEEEIGREREK